MKRMIGMVVLVSLAAAVGVIHAANDKLKLSEHEIKVLHDAWRAVQIKNTMGNYIGPELTGVIGQAHIEIQGELNRIAREQAQETLDANAEQFYQSLVPVYREYFNDAELKQIAAFYASDAGRKLLGLQGDLSRDILGKAQQWRESFDAEVTKDTYATLLKADIVKSNQKLYELIRSKAKP